MTNKTPAIIEKDNDQNLRAKTRLQCLSYALDLCLGFKDNASLSEKTEEILWYGQIFHKWVSED